MHYITARGNAQQDVLPDIEDYPRFLYAPERIVLRFDRIRMLTA